MSPGPTLLTTIRPRDVDLCPRCIDQKRRAQDRCCFGVVSSSDASEQHLRIPIRRQSVSFLFRVSPTARQSSQSVTAGITRCLHLPPKFLRIHHEHILADTQLIQTVWTALLLTMRRSKLCDSTQTESIFLPRPVDQQSTWSELSVPVEMLMALVVSQQAWQRCLN